MLSIGTVIRLDDVHTGFDHGKLGRPYCVVGTQGDPVHTYLLVPRSTQGTRSTLVPAGVVAGLNLNGRFMNLPHAATPEAVEAAPVAGILGAPYFQRVLDNINFIQFDLD